jgi:hypothetical protein
MAKETKKKVRLPALGKPKPKAKKTSARDLGKTANEQFKAGEKDKGKVTFEPNRTDKEAAVLISKMKKPKWSSKSREEHSKRRLARITGV